jgi:hypothetical protein
MKKILLLFLSAFLVLVPVNAQILRTNPLYTNNYTTPAAEYCDEYQAVYDAMTTPPVTYDADQNTLVEDLKAAGVWSKLILFYVFAQETNGASEAYLDWIDPTGDDNCTESGVITFVANSHVVSDGAASYLITNWNGSTEGGGIFSQNAASIGCYILNNVAETKSAISAGTSNYIQLFPRSSGGSFQGKINCNDNVINTAIGTSAGFSVIVRPDAANLVSYKNGGDVTNLAEASTGVDNYVLRLLNTSTFHVAFAFVGGILNATEVADMNTAVEKYMDALGIGVE